MSTVEAADSPGPEAVAEQMAQNMYDGATAIRESALGRPADEANRLNAQADQLEECADQYTADAIADILGTIQPDLNKITELTGEVNEQIETLKRVDDIITDGSLVLAVGTAALSGDSGAIIAAVQALGDHLSGEKSTSGSAPTSAAPGSS